MKVCTVCRSRKIHCIGLLQPYLDYTCDIYECVSCKSYFAERDASIYERLHESDLSTYADHFGSSETPASEYKHLSSQEKLSALLVGDAQTFVINKILALDKPVKILELGCSKGHVGALFIGLGYDYTGVDVSSSAIKSATDNFGNYFMVPGDEKKLDDEVFDVVFHLGTIGCVSDPLLFIEDNLKKLKPGGKLLFNAPNVEACKKYKDIWVTQTPPPDLVTLFSPKIWSQRFSEVALVSTLIRAERPAQILRKCLDKFRLGTTLKPAKTNLMNANEGGDKDLNLTASTRWRGIPIKIILFVTKFLFYKWVPAEFGVLVEMKKK